MMKQISHGDYLAELGYGSSFLNRVLISPAHALVGVEPSPAMKFGTFLHDMVLRHENPRLDNIEEQIAQAGIYQRGDALKRCARHMLGAYDALRSHSLAKRLLWRPGHLYEQSVFTEINSLPIKVRPDLLDAMDNMVIDVKTANSAQIDDFNKKIFSKELGYCVQAALYLDALERAIPENPYKVFCWVIVETDAPYGVNIVVASDDVIDIGRQRYLRAIEIVKECRAKNKWPCYEEKIHIAEKPKWVVE